MWIGSRVDVFRRKYLERSMLKVRGNSRLSTRRAGGEKL